MSKAALLLLLYLAVPPGVLVDRVLAVVGKEVLTQSEFYAQARVALIWQKGEAAAHAPIEGELFESLLEYVINQYLVAGEVRRLGGVFVSEKMLVERLNEFSRLFRNRNVYRAFLRRYHLSEDDLRHILRRRVRNEVFIRQRFKLSERGRLQDPDETSKEPGKKELQEWLLTLRERSMLRVAGFDGRLETR